MEITKKQLQKIIKEEKIRLREYLEDVGGDLGSHVVDFLRDQARGYHADPSLSGNGDKESNAEAIKILLQDDFMDNFGHEFDMIDFDYEIGNFAHGVGLREGKKMKITKKQLKRIIKEEKTRLLKEQDAPVQGNHDHHWPKVAWDGIVSDLVDQWHTMEISAHDPSDSSMTMDGEMSVTEAKDWWREQVDNASYELEELMVQEVRKVALSAMQNITDKLIDGQYS